MKKAILFCKLKGPYLLLIVLSWLLLMSSKNGILPLIKELSIPIALFWVGTGCLMSFFLFHRFIGIKTSPWKIQYRGFLMAFCGLIAYQLYFFNNMPMKYDYHDYFFLWVPLLYWVISTLFFGEKKRHFSYFLIGIAIFTALFIIEDTVLTILANISLVAFGLLALKKKENIPSLLMPAILFQILGGGILSLFHWQGIGNLSIREIYAAFAGGVALGFSLLIFLLGLQGLKTQNSLLTISICLVVNLTLPIKGEMNYLFSVFLIVFAIILFQKNNVQNQLKNFEGGATS